MPKSKSIPGLFEGVGRGRRGSRGTLAPPGVCGPAALGVGFLPAGGSLGQENKMQT